MRKLLALIALLTLGCGAQDDGYDDAGLDGALGEVSSDYGQAEQAYVSNVSGASGTREVMGVQLDSGRSGCNTGLSNNTECWIKSERNAVFCVLPTGWASTAERDSVRAALAPNVTAIVAQLNGVASPPAGQANWNVTVKPNGTACVSTDIKVFKDALPGVGGFLTATLWRWYTYTDALVMTEPVALNPKWIRGSQSASCGIDIADSNALGANAAQDSILLQRITTQCALYSLGIGATLADNTGFATDPFVNFGGFTELTPGQACRMQRFATSNKTQFQITTSPTCPNN